MEWNISEWMQVCDHRWRPKDIQKVTLLAGVKHQKEYSTIISWWPLLWRYFYFSFFAPWFSSLYPFLTWKHLVSHWWFPCLLALPNNWGHKHPYCNQSKMISYDCSYLPLCTCLQRLIFLLPIVCGYAISSVRICFIEHFYQNHKVVFALSSLSAFTLLNVRPIQKYHSRIWN